jgi:UDPglucose 6-dehydrogenase
MQHDRSVAIIGVGAVGRAMRLWFPDAVLYDEPLGLGSREHVNRCRFAFVCVPTPADASGACDTSIVEDVVAWCESETIILRSTVAPGTTDRLGSTYGKQVVFQPEYGPGETPDHPYADVRDIRWMILGGPRVWTVPVHDLYKRVVSSEVVIQQTDAVTAELAKYMENAFLATKVTFCNEFYDVASALGVDFNELRELRLLDPRMGRSHTWVHPDERGFGGQCLPKDLDALLRSAEHLGVVPTMLRAVAAANAEFRRTAGSPEAARENASLALESAGDLAT